MKTYDIYCQICGALDMNIDMEETEGLMECSGWQDRRVSSAEILSGGKDKKCILTQKNAD